MSKNRVSIEDLEALLPEAFRRLDLAMPITASEVAKAESETASELDPPDSLHDPFAVRPVSMRERFTRTLPPTPDACVDELRQAARNGVEEFPEHVRSRMEADRRRSEHEREDPER